MTPTRQEYSPIPVTLILAVITVAGAGFALELTGVDTFPGNVLIFGIAAAGIGYFLARSFRLTRIDAVLMAVVALVVCVFYFVAAFIGAAISYGG